MQHRYSELYLREKLPAGSYQGARFIGAGTACLAGVLGVLWVTGPHEPKYLAGFVFYLLIVGSFAVLLVLLRRMFRKPAALRTTTFEVDKHGLWRQVGRARKLLLGRAEVVSIEVFWSRLNDVLHIELRSKMKALRVQGLENMEQFSEELRHSFPSAAFDTHRPVEELSPPREASYDQP